MEVLEGMDQQQVVMEVAAEAAAEHHRIAADDARAEAEQLRRSSAVSPRIAADAEGSGRWSRSALVGGLPLLAWRAAVRFLSAPAAAHVRHVCATLQCVVDARSAADACGTFACDVVA
eukprot:gene4520-2214_t